MTTWCGFARQLNLDVDQFQKDLSEGRFKARVEEDFKSGVRSGVNGTPTFYINGQRYDGLWDVESLMEEIETPIGVQVRNLFQRFTRLQASGGILLVLATIVALFLANSSASEAYFDLWKTDFSITFGEYGLTKYLLKWINDGLMVLFFFVVGLEIKREITVGELALPRKAALPLMAALGGMVVPSLVYWIFNSRHSGHGWLGDPDGYRHRLLIGAAGAPGPAHTVLTAGVFHRTGDRRRSRGRAGHRVILYLQHPMVGPRYWRH